MDYKPSDFFIGVVDLFGILIPGAVLLFLDGDLLLSYSGLTLRPESWQMWAASFVGAYVLGHFLLGLGHLLNRKLAPRLDRWWSADMRPFYNDVKDRISLPDLVPKTPMNAFYAAYAFVRLKSPDALSEIDRQMADYKLFRGLTIVFALDLLFTLTRGGVEWSRLLFAAVLLVAAAARYQFLLGWTYKITFEYYALLKKAAVREDVLV